MKDYLQYEIEDFLLDDSFREWVKANGKNEFWEKWIKAHPEKEEVVRSARKIILELKVIPSRDLTELEESALVFQVTSGVAQPSANVFLHTAMRIAAGLLLLLAVGFGFIKYKNTYIDTQTFKALSNKQIHYNSSVKSAFVRLADGSSVILKPGSTLSYEKKWGVGKREVYLKGEAFFEITKDPSKPFMVHTGEIVTKVLGTSFLVTAKEGEDQIKVLVSTGRVSVSGKNLSTKPKDNSLREVLLTPRQQATFYKSKRRIVRDTTSGGVPHRQEIIRERMEFAQVPLSEVFKTLEEFYDVEMQYDQKKFSKCLLTASLLYQPLSEKLTIISKATILLKSLSPMLLVKTLYTDQIMYREVA